MCVNSFYRPSTFTDGRSFSLLSEYSAPVAVVCVFTPLKCDCVKEVKVSENEHMEYESYEWRPCVRTETCRSVYMWNVSHTK